MISTSSSSSSIQQQFYNKPPSVTSSTHYRQQQINHHYNSLPLSPSPMEQRNQSTMNLPINNIYPPSTSLDTPPVTPIVANWIMDQQHQQPSSSSEHYHHPIDLPSSPISPHPHRLSRNSLSKYDLYNNNNQMAISIASQPSLSSPSIISSTMHRLKSHRDAKKRRSQPLPYRHSLYDDVLNYFDFSSELGQDHDLNRDLNHLLSPTSSTQRQQRQHQHLVEEENNNRIRGRTRRRRSNESHQRTLSFHSSTSTSSSSIASSYMSLSSRPSIYSTLETNHQPWRHHQQLSPNYRRHDPYYKLNRNNNNKKRTRGGWNYSNGSRFSPLFYQLPLCALFIKQGILGLFSFLFGIVFGVFSYLFGGVQRILSWFKFLSVLSLALVISLGRGPSHMLASLDEGDYSDENINNEEDEDDYYMNHSF
ncbi:unnamed protein product [Cunninghamella echinulata]